MRRAAACLCLGVLPASAAAGDEAGAGRCVSALVSALKSGDEQTRVDAAREIARRRVTASRTTDLLRQMMLGERGDVLLAVADALERTRTNVSSTVKELAAQLAEPEASARARAAWALSLIPTADSATPEIAPLVEEADAWVQVSAACALLRFGHQPDRMGELLVRALAHDEARIRLRAIHGLRHVSGESERAVEALARVAAQGGPEGCRACLTLAELGPRATRALPTLRSLLSTRTLRHAWPC